MPLPVFLPMPYKGRCSRVHVRHHGCNQLFDGIEFDHGTQIFHEPDHQGLTVQVTVEVKDMDFAQSVGLPFEHGRNAHGDRRPIPDTVNVRISRVHAFAQRTERERRRKIGGLEPHIAPLAATVLDHAAQTIRLSEQPVRFVKLRLGEQATNARCRDGHAVLGLKLMSAQFDADGLRPCLKLRHAARSLNTEPKVSAHVQECRSVRCEHPLKKLGRAERCELARERQHDHAVYAA